MSNQPLSAILIGFGKIAAGNANNDRLARHYRYASHAQVLADHAGFHWVGVADPSAEARRAASEDWDVPHVAESAEALAEPCRPDVAVLATGPEHRLELIAPFGELKAVLVEKPLGRTLAEAEAFLEHCRARDIQVQVNYWRRADEGFQNLANGGLAARVGRPQAIFGVYGNGLRNNGSHLVDMLRMLFGEIIDVRALTPARATPDAPIAGDRQAAFAAGFADDLVATVQCLDFRQYRENGIEVWGTEGKLSMLQEFLDIRQYKIATHRQLADAREIVSDRPGEAIPPTVGNALWRLYDNLAAAVARQAEPVSTGENALATEAVLEAILQSADDGGRSIALGGGAA